MSKDIKKALEHCVEWNCDNCPNREELGSGEIVCRGRLLPEVLEYVSDLEAKLVESEKKASKKNDESWDLYLSLKQFYSRLGVEAYADDKIQDVAVKELNRLLNENEELKQQLAEKDKVIETILKENEELEEENKKLKKLLNNKILLAEDGSVDVDKLEQDGFYVIIYRQSSRPPMWLTHQHEDKGDEVV